jgi:hypothetical protein
MMRKVHGRTGRDDGSDGRRRRRRRRKALFAIKNARGVEVGIIILFYWRLQRSVTRRAGRPAYCFRLCGCKVAAVEEQQQEQQEQQQERGFICSQKGRDVAGMLLCRVN